MDGDEGEVGIFDFPIPTHQKSKKSNIENKPKGF